MGGVEAVGGRGVENAIGVPAHLRTDLKPWPTCYLASTAPGEAATAPECGDAMYVPVHTRYLRPGQNWKQMVSGCRQVVLDKLKRIAGMPDMEERIAWSVF